MKFFIFVFAVVALIQSTAFSAENEVTLSGGIKIKLVDNGNTQPPILAAGGPGVQPNYMDVFASFMGVISKNIQNNGCTNVEKKVAVDLLDVFAKNYAGGQGGTANISSLDQEVKACLLSIRTAN